MWIKPTCDWAAMKTFVRNQRGAHHMSHHFADIDTNFGISHRWVDRFMGTLKTRDGDEQRRDDNGSITPAR